LHNQDVNIVEEQTQIVKPLQPTNGTNGTILHNDKQKTILKKTNKPASTKMKAGLKLTFQLRYHTEYGQSLFIIGNHKLLGDGDVNKALPLEYFNDEYWYATIELTENEITDTNIIYNYILKNEDGTLVYDWGNDKSFNPFALQSQALIIDGWNDAGYVENAFYTEAFTNVLLKNNYTPVQLAKPTTITHTFRVKSPLLKKGQTLCIVGNITGLGNWKTEAPIIMSREEGALHFEVSLDLSNDSFPIAYKYGVYDVTTQKFLHYEDGNNRIVYDSLVQGKQTIINDAFAALPNNTFKGAGIAIPVFSLKTNQSFGVGEFTDIKQLVDWSKHVGLKLIQILPINDTIANHTWLDSYPYAAISAFALHPMFLNLEQTANASNKPLVKKLEVERKKLNDLEALDYDAVVNAKLAFIQKIYPSQKEETFASKDYQAFFEQNKHWLVPYAAFCYLRDEHGTANFSQWPAHSQYNANEIAALSANTSTVYDDIAINYFIQYHLHLQLKAATQYAHENGIIVKGDIPIGIYRNGADAWQQPELYHMDAQAGAPPDDFAVKGQNWGFPTYNWQRMQEDGFLWWKQRFEQMSYYFDAFRIDHILGFFRIWSIPMDAVEGILGFFQPAIPVHINEFHKNNIWFDLYRYTKPFINEDVLWQIFGNQKDIVKETYLNYDGFGNFTLKPAFATQRLVEKHFLALEENDENNKIKHGLYDLISNVILFEVEGSQGLEFHFRFGMEGTTSFTSLEAGTQNQLKDLYINYFYRRQDDFWRKQALQKLPALKRTTNMLICGEDLGMVPDCVPDVMRQLGLLSLEIQRMPKDPTKEFFNTADAPYLSVVTPSTHDMSTVRGWWEEDRTKTQTFFNNSLGQQGDAPFYCEPWLNKSIVMQHLYSPAMWSIFQLQDLLGMDEDIRRENPNDERINVPANPKNYWRYRMHLSLEDLLEADGFNSTLTGLVKNSGR
jgi:4-alpha-glucanotransferase